MPTELRARITEGLGNQRVRANIRRAMDHLMEKRSRAFPDAEERERLREQGRAIRAEALARLPDLLAELERTATANGIQVHWAETPADANRIVLEILRQHGASVLIKGKSMVSEEMGLNAFLTAKGIAAV
jgi:L-lactate dehydrogenase complex protein LldF